MFDEQTTHFDMVKEIDSEQIRISNLFTAGCHLWNIKPVEEARRIPMQDDQQTSFHLVYLSFPESRIKKIISNNIKQVFQKVDESIRIGF